VKLAEMVEQLREAMFGLAEREIPGDPLPCFCVRFEAASGVHDEWCEAARIALAETGDITVLLDSAANVVTYGSPNVTPRRPDERPAVRH
jgi:hypothetical protein